jgi:ankyrin repeat protein
MNNIFKLIHKNKWNELNKQIKHNNNSLNIADDNGTYFINYVISHNKISTIYLLNNKNMKLDILDNDGKSILYMPIKLKYNQMFNALMNLDNTCIGIKLVNFIDESRNTPLHYATQFNNQYVIKYLVDNNADINACNYINETPLHNATRYCNNELYEYILGITGININAKNNDGISALHITISSSNTLKFKMIINKCADVNILDKNKLTPIHYIVRMDNDDAFNILLKLKNNVDYNIQDNAGNSPLHYIVFNNKHNYIHKLRNDNLLNNINLNLFNVDNMNPLNAILHMYEYNVTNIETIRMLLINSNINIKNAHGYSSAWYLIKLNIWKQFVNELKVIRMDIFMIVNNKRIIDYVNDKDICELITIVSHSYLHFLLIKNVIWNNEWENDCVNNKQRKNESLKIIYAHIYNAYKKNMSITTYPRQYNIINVNNKTIKMDVCTYIGLPIDIVSGLIYILSQHTIARIIMFNYNNSDINKIIRKYDSTGIKIENIDLIYFQIIWFDKQLIIPTEMNSMLNKYMSNNSIKYIIIPLSIMLYDKSHHNCLIIDINNKEIERFEPIGFEFPNIQYEPDKLDDELKNIFNSFKYISPKEYIPKLGFQSLDAIQKSFCVGDPRGFCAAWVIWYIDMRMKHYYISRYKLIKILFSAINNAELSHRSIIREYSLNITKIRDNMLKQSKLNVNDIVNNTYTTSQIDMLALNINSELSKYDN